MKKIFTLSIIAIASITLVASCTKNDYHHSYVCTCTVNQYLTGNTSRNPVTSFEVEDATPNNAQSKCDMHMNAVLNNSGQSFTCIYNK